MEGDFGLLHSVEEKITNFAYLAYLLLPWAFP